MIRAFANENAPVCFEMTYQITKFHASMLVNVLTDSQSVDQTINQIARGIGISAVLIAASARAFKKTVS